MTQLAIVADDLTGAADTGACFANAGFSTVISLSGTAISDADGPAWDGQPASLTMTLPPLAVVWLVPE